MKKKTLAFGGGGLAALIVAGGIAAFAVGGAGDGEKPITGPAYQQAADAALAHTGGGIVTETEVGDEESLYEVEVTLADGSQVDVQLDERFNVVGSAPDRESPDDTDGRTP